MTEPCICGHTASDHSDDWGCAPYGQPMGCDCKCFAPAAPVGEPLCRCGHGNYRHDPSPSTREACKCDGGGEVEATWERICDDLPESFWKVATWDGSENWSPGSLDVADRKRIGLTIIKALREDRP